MASTNPAIHTQSHEKIRSWAETRGGTPAILRNAGGADALHIHFPNDDHGSKEFEKISWDQFFKTFEEKNLVFQYTADQDDTFHRFVVAS